MANTILFACDFFGTNPGNFIPSLIAMEKHLYDSDFRVIYAFPQECIMFRWYQQMIYDGRTLYAYKKSSLKDNIRFLTELYKKEKFLLIHTHF